MLSLPALTAAVAATHSLAVPLRDLAFRASHLRHFANFATAQPLFCAAAGAAGSRFVPPNGTAALYLALDVEAAYRELNQDFYRLARAQAGRALVRNGLLRPVPCAMLGIHVSVSRLLNLTRSGSRWRQTRSRLGIRARSDRELTQPWAGVPNAPTQLLGSEVFGDGFFEGILYPSAQSPGRTCVVLFRNRLLPTSRIPFHDGPTALTAQLP